MTLRRIVITGCSGGGKSTLIDALAARGFATMPEAGRILVREEIAHGGNALPWLDREVFGIELAKRAIAQFEAASEVTGTVLFDRGLIDPVAFLKQYGFSVPPAIADAVSNCRYDKTVFYVAPWEEIYQTEDERPKPFEEAVAEFDALMAEYRSAGYRPVEIPRGDIGERCDFMLNAIGDIVPSE